MFEEMALEYLIEAEALKNHIKMVSEELCEDLKNNEPQALWRISVLYKMYINLRQIANYLKIKDHISDI